jgi:hypothetical protein
MTPIYSNCSSFTGFQTVSVITYDHFFDEGTLLLAGCSILLRHGLRISWCFNMFRHVWIVLRTVKDMVNTELSVAFSPLRGISAGQYLELRAPQGFAFLERSFRPGEGRQHELKRHTVTYSTGFLVRHRHHIYIIYILYIYYEFTVLWMEIILLRFK